MPRILALLPCQSLSILGMSGGYHHENRTAQNVVEVEMKKYLNRYVHMIPKCVFKEDYQLWRAQIKDHPKSYLHPTALQGRLGLRSAINELS